MKEVSSCQENIDTEAISEKEKKKSWIRCSTKRAFLLAKSASYYICMKMLTWK